MNPMMTAALSAVLRHLLGFAGAYLVSMGVWDEAQASTVVSGVAMALAAVVLSLMQKYTSRAKLVTALASPAGTTEHQVEAKVSSGMAPPVTLEKTVAPQLEHPTKPVP